MRRAPIVDEQCLVLGIAGLGRSKRYFHRLLRKICDSLVLVFEAPMCDLTSLKVA